MQIIDKPLNEILSQIKIRTNQVTNRVEVEKAVMEIINNVAQNGDAAVKEYEKRFDNVDLDSLRVGSHPNRLTTPSNGRMQRSSRR